MLHDERLTIEPADQRERWARKRAEMLQGLYIHLFVFLIVNGGLVVVNWMTKGPDGTWWVRWPLIFWGLGLAIHVASTMLPVFSEQWVDRKTDELSRRQM